MCIRDSEKHFLDQGFDVNRTIDQTLDLGWKLLSLLPREALDRVDDQMLDRFYKPEEAKSLLDDKA